MKINEYETFSIMSQRNQFDKPLKLMKLSLMLAGIKVYHNQWHPITELFLNFFLYYFNNIILYTVIFAEIYWLVDGIRIGRDFVAMSLTAPCITISILGTLKAAPLYFKRDIIMQIIDTLEKIHPGYKKEINDNQNDDKNNLNGNKRDIFQELTEDSNYVEVNDLYDDEDAENEKREEVFEENLANDAVKMLRIVEFMLSWISVSVLVMFLLAPLLSMYWKYFKSGQMKIMYPFSIKYWFDAYEVSFWPLIYFHQVWATIIVCVTIFGTETLFYAVCTYIEMHFRMVSHRFENIRPASPRMHERLVTAVRKHQLLIHLVDQMESLYSVPVLLHIVSSSFLICLSAFNITVADDLGSVFAFVTFLVLSLSQVSLLCFFGDKLMRSSVEVSEGIYKCPWYHCTADTKKAVLIIVMRSQKPCKLTASNFADLNLRAFTTILSRSWSYFALLKTVYK